MAPLLPVLLLLLGLARSLEPCPGLCRCRGHRLDCSGAALARVPPARRRTPFSVLDFTGNALALIPPQAWDGYPWAEKLVLRDNRLRAVKRRSLERLLLLRDLDLSYNQIQAIEARAFEDLPFLGTINLEGNLLSEIRSDSFRAWHGMQFLQTLVLSHNPLSVIEDKWFFKLPSVTHLDLGATQVTRQTLLVLLLGTSRLETLKLSNDTACCLCRHKHSTETPCRTLSFDCASVCSASAPRCAPPAQTPGLLKGAVPPRKGNSSSMVKIQPKEPSLREQGTVTLAVVLGLSSSDAEPDLDLIQAESTLWEAARRLSISDILPVSSHRGAPAPPAAQPPAPYPSEAPRLAQAGWSHDHSDAVQQTNTADGMEDEEGAEDQKEAPAPTQVSAGTNSEQKLQGSGRTEGTELEEEELTAAEDGAERALSRMQRFYYALLANTGPPTASSAPETSAAAERSSGGGSPPTAPAGNSTCGQRRQQEPPVPTAPGSSSAPGGAATRGAPFDSRLSRHPQWLLPDPAELWFAARVARAVRDACGPPQLQPACSSVLSRTGLLLRLLRERQRHPEPSGPGRCVREEDSGTARPHTRGQARSVDSECAETEMAMHIPTHSLLLVLLLSSILNLITALALVVLCCFQVCAKNPAQDSPGSSRRCLRGCFRCLYPKWCSCSKDTDWDEDEVKELQTEPLWLQYVKQPLDARQQESLTELYHEEASGEEDIFNECGIAWLSIGSRPVTASEDRHKDSGLMPGLLAPEHLKSGAMVPVHGAECCRPLAAWDTPQLLPVGRSTSGSTMPGMFNRI